MFLVATELDRVETFPSLSITFDSAGHGPRQHHLGACLKYRLSVLTLDLLNQNTRLQDPPMIPRQIQVWKARVWTLRLRITHSGMPLEQSLENINVILFHCYAFISSLFSALQKPHGRQYSVLGWLAVPSPAAIAYWLCDFRWSASLGGRFLFVKRRR